MTPIVGAKWLSEDSANYFFGTLDEEVARRVVDYKPGSVTIPRVGVSYYRRVGKKWLFIANVDYSPLPDEIKMSPLVEPDTATIFIGFSRGFTPSWIDGH